MRTSRTIVCLSLLISMMNLVLSAAVAAEMRLTTGIRYNGARDDLAADTSGREFTLPLGLVYTRKNLSVSLQTGYARARVTPPEGDAATLAGLTDTLLSVNYAVSGLPVLLSLGLSLNLPTGQERLSPEEAAAIVGESNDLFEVEKFGEGLNIGFNLSVMKQFDNVAVGLNGLFVDKGSYDPTTAVAQDKIDPGDQFLVAGVFSMKASAALTIVALGTYSSFGNDQVEDQDSFQEGRMVTLGGAVNYVRQPIVVSVSAMGLLPQKDRELVDGQLQTEAANSGQNTLITAVNVSYAYSPEVSVDLVGDVRYYAESDRTNADRTLPYAGQRVRYSIGPGVRMAFSKQIAGALLVKYVVMHEHADIALSTDRTFDSLAVNLGLTYTF